MKGKNDSFTYVEEGIDVLFDKDYAEKFQPIVYDRKGFGTDPEAKGMYYRILEAGEVRAIQLFIYWEKQDCTDEYPLVGEFFSHSYDYEPVIVFVRGGKINKVVIAGAGGLTWPWLGHQTEIYREEESNVLGKVTYRTSPEPHYPYGEHTEEDMFKAEPLTRVSFKGTRLMIGLATCYHVYTTRKHYLTGQILDPPLKRLTDDILNKWYKEEHFGHDVSNPWKHPHIRFHSPPKLELSMEKRRGGSRLAKLK